MCIRDRLLQAIGLDPEVEGFESRRLTILRAMDKYDRLGLDGVTALLGDGRKDESGDFTKGAGLDAGQIDKVAQMVSISADDRASALESMAALVKETESGKQGLDELVEMAALFTKLGYDADRLAIDPSVVRGLGYYTGPVYEAELTFEIKDEKDRPRQFGSVAGGGRYDDLVKRFTGQEVPATGVSIGVDRLLAALRMKGQMHRTQSGPVVITVMDRARMGDYQAMAKELRAAGIRAEVYLGNPKNFGNQLKYADNRNSPIAIIEGGDEQAAGIVQIKDLILGAQLAKEASLEEWKARPSQIEAPRAQLVDKVREMLVAQGTAQ